MEVSVWKLDLDKARSDDDSDLLQQFIYTYVKNVVINLNDEQLRGFLTLCTGIIDLLVSRDQEMEIFEEKLANKIFVISPVHKHPVRFWGDSFDETGFEVFDNHYERGEYLHTLAGIDTSFHTIDFIVGMKTYYEFIKSTDLLYGRFYELSTGEQRNFFNNIPLNVYIDNLLVNDDYEEFFIRREDYGKYMIEKRRKEQLEIKRREIQERMDRELEESRARTEAIQRRLKKN